MPYTMALSTPIFGILMRPTVLPSGGSPVGGAGSPVTGGGVTPPGFAGGERAVGLVLSRPVS